MNLLLKYSSPSILSPSILSPLSDRVVDCTDRKIRVCIIGAGIGGMTAAHYLAQHPDAFDVTIIERNPIVGGQARSSQRLDGLHTEYCWHAVAEGYHHLTRLLGDLEDSDGNSMLIHLKRLDDYYYVTKHGPVHNWMNSFLSNFPNGLNTLRELVPDITLWDIIKLRHLSWYIQTLPDTDLSDQDEITWRDFLQKWSLKPSLLRWLIDSTSIYLGMEYNDLSAYMMIRLLRKKGRSEYLPEVGSFFMFDGPMNDVWLNPWQKYLEKLGVHFFMDTKVTHFQFHEYTINKVHSVHIPTRRHLSVECDYVINALSIEGIARIYPLPHSRLRLSRLASLSHQIQTQVLFYFKKRLPIKDTTVFVFPDTPWFLMARHEGSFWDLSCGDYLSCGIGIWDVVGLYGKTALECTRNELVRECWDQMQMDSTMNELPIPVIYTKSDIWSEFVYDHKTMKLTTSQPKFSNNVGTYKYRPNVYDDHLSNLFHATAYTKTYQHVFNMESAVEAGVRAANQLLPEKGKPQNVIVVPTPPSNSTRMWRSIRLASRTIRRGITTFFRYLYIQMTSCGGSRNILPPLHQRQHQRQHSLGYAI